MCTYFIFKDKVLQNCYELITTYLEMRLVCGQSNLSSERYIHNETEYVTSHATLCCRSLVKYRMIDFCQYCEFNGYTEQV